jgi:hypothetical protein
MKMHFITIQKKIEKMHIKGKKLPAFMLCNKEAGLKKKEKKIIHLFI